MTTAVPASPTATSAPGNLAGLRVLTCCDYYDPEPAGGAERVALEVARRLAGWGADVVWVSGVPGGSNRPTPHEAEPMVVRTQRAYDLSPLLGAQLALSPPLFRTTGRAGRDLRPHVVHAHSIHFPGSLAAARWARRAGVPLVTTLHVGSIDALPRRMQLGARIFEATIGRRILAASSRIIAVSEDVARHATALGVPPDRVEVVRNGVDLTRYQPTDRRDDGPLRVVFVGRLIANKGPEVLIEALVQLAQRGIVVDARIIGDGPQRGDLERRVRNAGIVDRVTFVGRSAEVPAELRRADVMVRPSLTEGLSLAMLEAMASGVAVVATDIPANAEVIRHDRSGWLVPVGDAAAVADALAILSADPERRRALVVEGLAVARDLSWDATAAGTARVLQLAMTPVEDRPT